ncbi:MAG: NACHT domain-containing protein [Cyanobacteria bacterium P01_D01_bin.156]
MAAKAYEVDKKIFQALLVAYQEKCGSSPSNLIDRLNQAFPEDLDVLRKKRGGSTSRDLISDKTIRNFFNSDQPGRMVEKNLNFLCRYLLSFSSYRDALNNYKSGNTTPRGNELKLQPSKSLVTSWIEPYVAYFIKKYDQVRIPNMTRSAHIDSVYTESMLSEDLRIRRRKSFLELQAEMEPNYVETKSRTTVSDVFSEHERLMVWGPAGSGKTTSLKFYALRIAESLRSKPDGSLVPIFIECSRFSTAEVETDLLKVIAGKLEHGDMSPEESQDIAKDLLKHGQCIVLLDGLDEVPKDIRPKVSRQFDILINKYPKNRFILTCRYGATESVPENFTEVEMTDFDQKQIYTFVHSWFKDNDEKGVIRRFLAYLKEHSNIGKLAKNPLLLTMLCSIYEQGYEFPKGKSSLFEDATDLYLRKWDSYRRIDHRDKIYDGLLSRPKRRDLFSRLAYEGMNRQDIAKSFWRRTDLQKFIREYIENLKDAKEKSLDDDARQILDALESQDSLLTRSAHEVYTFSYEGFSAYFTAMKVKEEMGTEPKHWNRFLKEHALQPEWRESLLFTAEQLSEANTFLKCLFKLMQQQLDVLSDTSRQRLMEAFEWLEQATDGAKVSSSAWRACFLSFDLETDLRISRKTKGMDNQTAQRVATKLRAVNKQAGSLKSRTDAAKLSLDLAVIHTLVMDRAENLPTKIEMLEHYDPTYRAAQQDISDRYKDSIELAEKLKPELAEELHQLTDSIPNLEQASCKACQNWAEALQVLMKQYLYEGYAIVLEPQEVDALNNYLYLCELLVDCLQADIYCSKSLREDLLEALMLPSSSDKIPGTLL